MELSPGAYGCWIRDDGTVIEVEEECHSDHICYGAAEEAGWIRVVTEWDGDTCIGIHPYTATMRAIRQMIRLLSIRKDGNVYFGYILAPGQPEGTVSGPTEHRAAMKWLRGQLEKRMLEKKPEAVAG